MKKQHQTDLAATLHSFEVIELEEWRLHDVRGGERECGNNCECNSTIGCGPDVNIPC